MLSKRWKVMAAREEQIEDTRAALWLWGWLLYMAMMPSKAQPLILGICLLKQDFSWSRRQTGTCSTRDPKT